MHQQPRTIDPPGRPNSSSRSAHVSGLSASSRTSPRQSDPQHRHRRRVGGVSTDLPPTRWEGPTDIGQGYGRHFADLIASGADVEGEARLADVLAPRRARILDAGSGMGRIGAALRRAGHEAYGVDLDAGLVDQSRAAYPDLPVAQARLEQLDGAFLARHGMPAAYDLVVCVGNVMVLLAEGSERSVLGALRGLLAPGGRVLAGFSLV